MIRARSICIYQLLNGLADLVSSRVISDQFNTQLWTLGSHPASSNCFMNHISQGHILEKL